jgi:ribonuclease T1
MARFPFPFPRSPSPYPRPRRRYPRRVGFIGALALLIAAVAGGISHCGQPTATTPPARPVAVQPTAEQPVPAKTATTHAKKDARTDLRVPEKPPAQWEVLDGQPVTARDEVVGIWDTLRRVVRGPPFPHRQDGVPFQNRENRLAKRESGWWREYTVETPGSDDRGARRLVIGADGEVWYSADHYRTFARLLLP